MSTIEGTRSILLPVICNSWISSKPRNARSFINRMGVNSMCIAWKANSEHDSDNWITVLHTYIVKWCQIEPFIEHIFSVSLSISVYLSLSLSLCPSVGRSVSLSVCLSVCLSVRPSVSLSVCLSVCVYPWMDGRMDGWIDRTGCRVQVFSLILDSSVGLSAGIQSAGE